MRGMRREQIDISQLICTLTCTLSSIDIGRSADTVSILPIIAHAHNVICMHAPRSHYTYDFLQLVIMTVSYN